MAKFIEINSSGSGLAGGKILLGVNNINGVIAASATTTVIKFNGGGLDEATITHTSVGTVPSVRDAVNAALTANPGGVKAKVNLPAGITVSAVAIA
ncbi:MAG: hypothetical protein GY928_38630 [Colwellia sp.]|nr:hypothetical protein [Colwellia sp.]